MAIILPSGFQITNNEPGDSRVVVADQAARLAFSAANVFKGLLVFQQDTQELYVLTVEDSPSNISSWSKIFTATGTSGSYTGSFSGDGSGLTGIVPSGGASLEFALSSGEGINNFIYNASEPITVEVSGVAQLTNDTIVKWNDTDGKFVTSSLFDNGTVVSGTTSVQLTGTNSILSGSFSGSFQGNGSALTGIAATLAVTGSSGNGNVDLKTQALSILGTANEILTTVSDQTITVGLPTNVTITGDLTVNGTTTTINTENLLIEDRFALLASGTTTGTDGGIIIQSNIAGTGFALGYKSGSGRWVLEDGLSGAANNFVSPNAFIGTVQTGSTAPEIITPAYGGSTSGHGTIFIDSSAQDIWIYA